jgi:hypothetical protein
MAVDGTLLGRATAALAACEKIHQSVVVFWVLDVMNTYHEKFSMVDRRDADEPAPARLRRRPLVLAIHAALLVGATSGLGTGEAIAAQITPNPNTGTISVVGADSNALNPFNNNVGGSVEIGNYGALTNQNAGVLNNAGTITNAGGLYNDGALNNSGALSNYSILSNAGEVNNQDSGELTNSGYLTNSNQLRNDNAQISNNGFLYNEGALVNQNGGALANFGYLNNGLAGTATLSNEAGASLSNYFVINNYSGSTITNAGSLDNHGGLYSDGALVNDVGADLQNRDGAFLSNIYGGLITNRSSIVNDGGFVNDGDVENAAGGVIVNNAFLYNNRSLTNRAGASITNNSILASYAGGLYNGAIVNEAGATLTNASTGALYNFSGSLANAGTLNNSGLLYNTGTITNTGTFAVAGTGSVIGDGRYTQSAGEALVDGLLQAAVLGFTGGSMAGNGTYQADEIDIGAGVAVLPGASVGTMTFAGDALFNGDLFIEVTGVGAGLFDLLDISGFQVDFGPDASITFDFGYVPMVGDSFEFLLADSVLDWLVLPLSFTGPVGYSIDGMLSRTGWGLAMGVTSVAAAPVPSPLVLLSFGLFGVAWHRRRCAHG